jgi:flagellar biosynthesis protein FlhB
MGDEDKQFDASPEKIQKAREQGQVSKSQDMSTAITILVMFSILLALGPFIWNELSTLFIVIFEHLHYKSIEEIGPQFLILVTIKTLVFLIAPFLLIGALLGIAVNVAQVGPLLALKAIEPKFDKLNPMSGFKNIFSQRTVVELIKNILKISVLGYVGYLVFMEFLPKLLVLGGTENIFSLLGVLGQLVSKYVMMAGFTFLAIGGADFMYQKGKFMKDQKMSMKELKDEYKNSEGDPHVKAAIRQRQMQMLQQSMLDAVPTADVVTTNPIHIAVAIAYNGKEMQAPRVVAKGAELFAEKIKALAKQHDIPVVENPAVARSLYSLVDLDNEIPANLYQAVAEILMFAWKVKGVVPPLPPP